MRIKIVAFVAILFILAALSVSFDSQAQTKPQATPTPTPSKDDVIRVETDLVTLTATVIDDKGRYKTDLKQSDFTIYEDGAKQNLTYFDTDHIPISLGIIIDTSGSMEDKMDGVQDAVTHFVKSVSPKDEIFLIQFSDDADIIQNFTDDHNKILKAVNSLEPRGSTALYDAIALGLQKVKEGKNKKRALMILTDGNDTASSIKFETMVSLARKSEVIIYGLGIGHGEKGSTHNGLADSQIQDTVDMRTLRTLADATGGNAYYLENAHENGRDRIDEATEEVAKELKQQYMLGYEPSNKKHDGSYRQIVIELKDKALKVRTKRGYYAKDDQKTSE